MNLKFHSALCLRGVDIYFLPQGKNNCYIIIMFPTTTEFLSRRLGTTGIYKLLDPTEGKHHKTQMCLLKDSQHTDRDGTTRKCHIPEEMNPRSEGPPFRDTHTHTHTYTYIRTHTRRAEVTRQCSSIQDNTCEPTSQKITGDKK